MTHPADSDAYLCAIRDGRLAVLRTAKLTGSPDLFSVRSLFAALAASGEMAWREGAARPPIAVPPSVRALPSRAVAHVHRAVSDAPISPADREKHAVAA
jgi:hypothetical protein